MLRSFNLEMIDEFDEGCSIERSSLVKIDIHENLRFPNTVEHGTDLLDRRLKIR